jgi:hypothetical protein
LAKERSAGHVCEAEAHQSTIVSELARAVNLSPYLKKEVLKGTSESARALHEALAGNLMLFDLIGKMNTPEQVTEAMIGSVWYSQDGGALGSSSILRIGKRQVRELLIDPDTYNRRAMMWVYRFDAKTRKLSLFNGMRARQYRLEKVRMNGETAAYELVSARAHEVNYSNEPDDCSA